MKFATIVPLIGGMTLGNIRATGEYPQFLVGYKDFKDNESHLKKYLSSVPHYEVENDQQFEEVIDEQNTNLDFVSTLCPCAGLSQLNTCTLEESQYSRGIDAVQNNWMYKTTQNVLSTIKPKVFFGENAPNLFNDKGKPVVNRLYQIGRENGYSMSLVKTSAFLHGLPQKRPRTFYFFWNTEQAPILEYYNQQTELDQFLFLIPTGFKHENDFFHTRGKATQNPFIKFIMNKKGLHDYREYISISRGKTAMEIVLDNEALDECIAKMETDEQYLAPKLLRWAKHVRKKINQKKGFWDVSPLTPGKDLTYAVISKNMSRMIHPFEDRFINIREHLSLMGMPFEFTIEGKSDSRFQQLTQNVPVNASRDWTYEVHKYCQGKLPGSGYSFIKQDNIKQKIIDKKDEANVKPLF